MEGGHLPEDVAERAREMMETRGDEERPEASVESSLQLQKQLRDLDGIEQEYLSCDSTALLPGLARRYAEAHERTSTALNAVQREACIEQIPLTPRVGITTRG